MEFQNPSGRLGLKHTLEEELHVEKVDLLTRDGFRPALKERILGEAICLVWAGSLAKQTCYHSGL